MRDDFVACRSQPRMGNIRGILKVVGLNLLFILIGLLLIWIVGEAYWRLNGRFGNVIIDLGSEPAYWRFVPGVGLLRPPHSELTLSNGINYWMVQRANSLGFLEREPIVPGRAAESCHISIIGDSFVEAKEVPISDKLQVRLEEIATRKAPHLDVTTSAFGIQHTGQMNQLPLYDRYARRMSPDLVVLVFVTNDLVDNSTERYALMPGHIPDGMPYGQATRGQSGDIRWLPPAVDFSEATFSRAVESLNSWNIRIIYRLARSSYFMRWMGIKTKLIGGNDWVYEWFVPSEDYVRRYTEWKRLIEDRGIMFDDIEGWGFTSLGLEQFKRRAEHDGVALIVLASYDLGGRWYPLFERLSTIAESLGIPVVSQYDYIISQDGRIVDTHLQNDYHWTPAGHQWAAEAIWEYVEEEWGGNCPQVAPRPDIKVDWVAVAESPNEVEYKDTVQTLGESLGLRHRIRTPEGEVWVQSFPEFDLEGYQSLYESVTSRRPMARSDWDVHFYAEGLTYLKKPCIVKDSEPIFFLHVVPVDANDLLGYSQSRGFENLDFYFGARGVTFDGICMVSVDLPEYEIKGIRTGQVADGVEIWSVDYNFALPGIMDALRELQQSGIEPDIRSDFDVYINDDRLIYMKDYCDADDHDTPFFLHVFPADEDDLPVGREDAGFDNLGFELIDRGGMHDGGCLAVVDLPRYDIASIRTGQVVEGAETWRAYHNFNFPETLDAVQEIRRSGREPDIRSNFNVYIDDGRLVYMKDSCSADDRDLPFFLHVFPSDESNLRAGREESGFDNLGFELMRNGGESDGVCFASVDLPEYKISSIMTGQWVRGEGNVWEASIDFAK